MLGEDFPQILLDTCKQAGVASTVSSIGKILIKENFDFVKQNPVKFRNIRKAIYDRKL